VAAKIHELLPELPLAVPLEPLCRQLDIASIERIETDAFEAALVMDELKAKGGILLAAGRRPERSRFSIAHELGHFLIPSHRPEPGGPFECSLGDLQQSDTHSHDRRRRIEAEANRFAAHLLMPPKRVRTMIGRSGSDL
jgi:Zn-dependent peptidase ImmA (M78 family)